MLTVIQRYVHERRGGFIRSATFLYGSYTLSAYVSERLDEMKDKMLGNKLARDKCVWFSFARSSPYVRSSETVFDGAFNPLTMMSASQ